MRMKIALIRLQSFYESFHTTLNGRVRNGWVSGNDKKKKKKVKILSRLMTVMRKQLFVLQNRCFKNFTIFTGKHLCCSLFFNKVIGLRLL